MQICRLPPEEDAVRRYTEELWLPYHRDLEAAVEDHALADEMDRADIVDAEVEFRLDKLAADGYAAWVVVDDGDADDVERATAAGDPLAETAGAWVAFVTTSVDECPTVFDRPDRLVVGDIYVTEPYRGTDLARELVDLAVDRARDLDCPELALDVDVDNERALALYEKLGFEPRRHRMVVPAGDL